MTHDLALMFPGQGAYLPGMFAQLDAVDGVAEVLETVDQVAREAGTGEVSPLLYRTASPKAEELVQTDPERLHLAIYAGTVAAARVLTGPAGIRPAVLFGHSVGELAALASAQALDVADGARILAARDEAFRSVPPLRGGMYAVMLGADRLAALIEGCGLWNTVVAADNAPRQAVVSGPDDELDTLRGALDALGVNSVRLRSAYPFHSPLLAGVAARFNAAIADIPVRVPTSPVFSPVTGEHYREPEATRAAVVHHLLQPVGFRQAIVALYGRGVSRLVDTGPKAILADLVEANLPQATVLAPLRARTTIDQIRALLGAGTGSTPAVSARWPAGRRGRPRRLRRRPSSPPRRPSPRRPRRRPPRRLRLRRRAGRRCRRARSW